MFWVNAPFPFSLRRFSTCTAFAPESGWTQGRELSLHAAALLPSQDQRTVSAPSAHTAWSVPQVIPQECHPHECSPPRKQKNPSSLKASLFLYRDSSKNLHVSQTKKVNLISEHAEHCCWPLQAELETRLVSSLYSPIERSASTNLSNYSNKRSLGYFWLL